MTGAPVDDPRGPTVARGACLAFAVALATTILMAAPVVVAPRERLFGSGQAFGSEDPNRDALIVIEQFRTGLAPTPYLQPLTDIPGRLLAFVVGPVAAYNLVVLATFPLSAATAYLLARYVLGSHLGAMVAGLAYAFLPFHTAQASGHPHVAQTQWLPLYFLALFRCLDRPDVRHMALLLAFGSAAILSNFYGGLMIAVLTPVALIAYGLVSPRRPDERRGRAIALTGLTCGVGAAAALLLIHHVAPAVWQGPGDFAFPRSDLFLYSARGWSYLVPRVDHPLLGLRVREFWVGRGLEAALLEQQVGLGSALLVLAALPMWRWLRGDRASLLVRSVPVLASVGCAAFLCSLSPEWRIGSFVLSRPSAVLYALAPMFRSYARFGVVVGLTIALLAGAGATCLRQAATSARARAATLLLGLAALECAPLPPWGWREVMPTRAHQWLARQSGSLRVLDCAPPSLGSDTLALPLVGHEVSMLGSPNLDDCGEPRLGDKLMAMDYTHAVVRRDSVIGTWLSNNPAPGGLARVREFADGWILRVTAAPPGVYVNSLLDFYPREFQDPTAARASGSPRLLGAPPGSRGELASPETTWRWMGQKGSLRLFTTRESSGSVLYLDLQAFPRERRVEWFLDGRKLGEVKAAAEWRSYELALGRLAPGAITLTLVCDEPASVANEIRHNGDLRALGLAVGQWRIENRD
jgi:hypothetical protein